jgi:hypothetical protein
MHFKSKQYIIRLFYVLLGDLINAENVLQKQSIESYSENHLNYLGRGGVGTGTQRRTGILTGIRTGTQTGTCAVDVKILKGTVSRDFR